MEISGVECAIRRACNSNEILCSRRDCLEVETTREEGMGKKAVVYSIIESLAVNERIDIMRKQKVLGSSSISSGLELIVIVLCGISS